TNDAPFSSARRSALSRIQTSASSPERHARPWTAPSTLSGSSSTPLGPQPHLCSDSVVGCSLAPAARPDGSLPFVPDRLHRPTLASLLRAVDWARSRHQKRWPPSPPPCESVLSCCPPPRAPSFRNTTDSLFWSDASPDRTFARGSLVDEGA